MFNNLKKSNARRFLHNISNDMKIAVHKNHLGGLSLYWSLDPFSTMNLDFSKSGISLKFRPFFQNFHFWPKFRYWSVLWIYCLSKNTVFISFDEKSNISFFSPYLFNYSNLFIFSLFIWKYIFYLLVEFLIRLTFQTYHFNWPLIKILINYKK